MPETPGHSGPLTGTPEQIASPKPEAAQYDDNLVVYRWNSPGDTVQISPGTALTDPAELWQPGAMTIIRTEDGRAFGTGAGLFVGPDGSQRVDSLPNLTVGSRLSLVAGEPSVKSITQVASTAHPRLPHLRQLASQNPFPALAQHLTDISAAEKNQTSQTVFERNRDILNQSELGWALNEAYTSFVRRYERNFPGIREVPIVPLPEDSPAVAQARPGWNPNGNKFEVHLRVGDWNEVARAYEEVDRFAPSSREEIASLYGITVEQVTPQLQYVTSLMHEFGHVIDYMVAGSREAWQEQKQRDSAEFQRQEPWLARLHGLLPQRASKLRTPEGRREVAAKLPELQRQLGTSFTVDSAIDNRARAHRRTPAENRADQRAVKVIKDKPVLLKRLANT